MAWGNGLDVLLALAGTRLPQPHKLFIAWFGPKGVASMLFALLVLNSAVPHHELVFETASFVIITSIVVHGLTDTIGTTWLERRTPRESKAAEEEDVPSVV